MEPIPQTIIAVDQDKGYCMVKSSTGKIYPIGLNRYAKTVNVGDTALVVKSNVSKEWLMVDVINKYPYVNPIDIVDFPRDETNCLNFVEYCKYRDEFDKLRSDRERNEMNEFLLNLFVTKYGMKSLAMKYQLDIEPQVTLEDYV